MALILGVDEAGRGPLAGPLAVGVVAYEEGYDLLSVLPGLNDSKKLSEKKRIELFKKVQEEMRAGNVRVAVKLSSAKMIDEKGVTYAISHALARGVRQLLPDPATGKVWLDGSLAAPAEYEQETVVGGDALIPAIMLASICAKVTRDYHMEKLAEEYPQYGFDVHKGYGTKAHYAALKLRGTCPEHRQLFLRKWNAGKT